MNQCIDYDLLKQAIHSHRISDILIIAFVIIFYLVLYILAALCYIPLFFVFNKSMKVDIQMKREFEMLEAPNKFHDFITEVKWEIPIPQKLHFKKEGFPFTPNDEQVIYIESEYSDFYNDYIKKNYDELKVFFNDHRASFCYLPQIRAELANKDIIQYRNPTCDIISTKENTDDESCIILHFLTTSQEVQPGLIRFDPTNDGEDYIFNYYPFTFPQQVPLEEQIRQYGLHLKHYGNSFYSLSKTNDEETADDNFSYETHKLIDEVRERVDKLHQMGVSEMVLARLFQPDDKLSRLVITYKFHIMLPDYNNMEITMSPLPKAVFFLFLRHPEGILFKQLMDYHKELTYIYNKISNRTIKKSIDKSIADITDPTNNSINEKCARIREAFINKFDERLACNYFVTGKRGEPKKILLPPDMVKWEIEL